MKKSRINPDLLPKFMFFFSLFCLAFIWGLASEKYSIFPRGQIEQASTFAHELLFKVRGQKHWYYQPTSFKQAVPTLDSTTVKPFPTLMTCVGKDGLLFVRIIDIKGKIIHEWKVDWFELWPDANHVPESDLPKERPGTHIQGIKITHNGDIIFNFDGLGLVRMDVCGNVRWKLPIRTHHSVYRDEDGFYWVPVDSFYYSKGKPGYKYLEPIFVEPGVLKLTPEGEIVSRISVMEVIKHNDLEGYFVLSSKARRDIHASGDILHLNKAATFPKSMPEGVFKHGDLLLSLRNLHTIMVIDPKTLDIRYIKTGGFIRQHDPDFVDGNILSIYDNNNINRKGPRFSRIVTLDARTDEISVAFQGTAEQPFFSASMGTHQWLADGTLLITETNTGRIFQVDAQGHILWQYINLVEDGWAGIIEEAERISPRFNRDFFKQQIKACE